MNRRDVASSSAPSAASPKGQAGAAKKPGRAETSPGTEKGLFGCVRRREFWFPTWRGWLLLFMLVLFLGGCFVLGIHPFLAPNDPLPGGILVVEGWAPDYALKIAVEEVSRAHYERMYVTGGPLERGAPLSEYKTYAELGEATLIKLGLSSNVVQAVPAPRVQQDRTYNSAVALAKYLAANKIDHPRLNLISVGPHARRSRFLFEKAFGPGTRVGVIAIEPQDYKPGRWWRSSQGVRVVLSEIFAYAYFRCLFRPESEALADR
jgi:hypothetical protein